MYLRSRPRALALLALAASLVLSGGVPATADTELGDHGHVGPHMLDDAAFSPGATCVYTASGGNHRLLHIKVKGPYLDVAGATSQKVGWDVRLQRASSPGGPWKTVSVSSRTTGISKPASDVRFDPKTVVPTGNGFYRVLVDMYWYRSGSVVGWSRHLVDYMKVKGLPTASPPVHRCGSPAP